MKKLNQILIASVALVGLSSSQAANFPQLVRTPFTQFRSAFHQLLNRHLQEHRGESYSIATDYAEKIEGYYAGGTVREGDPQFKARMCQMVMHYYDIQPTLKRETKGASFENYYNVINSAVDKITGYYGWTVETRIINNVPRTSVLCPGYRVSLNISRMIKVIVADILREAANLTLSPLSPEELRMLGLFDEYATLIIAAGPLADAHVDIQGINRDMIDFWDNPAKLGFDSREVAANLAAKIKSSNPTVSGKVKILTNSVMEIKDVLNYGVPFTRDEVPFDPDAVKKPLAPTKNLSQPAPSTLPEQAAPAVAPKK